MAIWSKRGIKIAGASLLIWAGGAAAPVGSPASGPAAPDAPLVSAALR